MSVDRPIDAIILRRFTRHSRIEPGTVDRVEYESLQNRLPGRRPLTDGWCVMRRLESCGVGGRTRRGGWRWAGAVLLAAAVTSGLHAQDADEQPGVAVITLEGQVGGHTNRGVRATFDAQLLATLLRKAAEADAQAVVIALNSTGGVIDESTRICDAMSEHSDDLRIIVYPRSAHYEAAPIALAARELAVWPGSHIGVPEAKRSYEFDRDGNPNRPLPEIDWRNQARVRAHLEAAERAEAFSVAMYDLARQMFWCPKFGIRWEPPEGWGEEKIDPKTGEVIPPPIVPEEERWIMLDGPESLLGLNGRVAHQVGLATFLALGNEDLIRQLGMSPDTPIITYDDLIEQDTSELQEQFATLERQVRTFTRYLERFASQLGDLTEVIDGDDRNAINRERRSIGRTRSALLRAARGILRSDDRVLRRIVREPSDLRMLIESNDAVIDRMARGSRDTRSSLQRDMRSIEDISEALAALLEAGKVPTY